MGRKRFLAKIGIIIPFFAIFLMSQNTFATSYSITSGTLYRAFSACPSQGSCTFTANNSTFSTVPTSALQSRDNNLRYLNGLFTSGNIQQGSSSNSVNSINNIVFGFNQDDNSSTYYVCPNFDAMWNYGQTDDSMKPRLRLYNGSTLLNVQYPMSVTCNEIQNVGIVEIYVTFSGYSTTDNTPINAFDFKWGDITTPTSPTPAITGIKSSNNTPSSTFAGSVNYLGMSYEYTTSNDPNAAYQSTIINQNNTMINNQQQIIEHNNKEEAASSNIQNQTAPNGTSNQQSTNLIGVLSNFVGAISNLSATNCNVILPFPNFLGGSMQVNICQNKDKAGDLISIIGSLIMIGFYLPLAIVLLRMIYNEIRSFTNG